MGIIQKQAFQSTIVTYLGAALGFATTVLIFPRVFNTSEIGLFRILVSVSLVFSQFGNLGVQNAVIRFFPYFRTDDKKHNGILFYPLIVSFIGFIICLVIFFLMQDWIIARNSEKSQLFVDYILWLLPLALFTIFFNIFDAYARALYKSVVGSLLKEVAQRLLILLGVLFYWLGWVNFTTMVTLYVIGMSLPTLLLLGYLIQQGELSIKPNHTFLTKTLVKDMISLSAFSILTNLSSSTIATIDSILVNNKLGLSDTGIYAITFYVGASIVIPARSIYRISTSILADAWQQNDLKTIFNLYYKSSINQLIIGLFLFLIVWVNVDELLQFFPAEFAAGKYVIFFIALGNVIDMAAGVNGQIVSASKYYRYDTLFAICLVILTISFNLLLIPRMGITGSAVATAITLAIYNFMRFLFLYIKFGMQPFDMNTVKVILVATLSFLAVNYIPSIGNWLLDIAIKSILLSMVFVPIIYKLKVAENFNAQMRQIVEFIFRANKQ